MYKGASQALQRAYAVDKPHPSRGYIEGPSDARDVLPSPDSMTEAQLKSEQAQLRIEMQKIEQELAVAKALGKERAVLAIGQRKMVHQTRLSAVNAALRALREDSDHQILGQAVCEVCDEEMRNAIFARCRELRASGTEARQRQDAEERLDPKGDGPTAEGGDAQPQPEKD